MYKIIIDSIGIKVLTKTVNEITSFIPVNTDNTDYQEYLKWVAKGNVAEEVYPNGN